MSRLIQQPSNQVKLTNVAVVRCNKNGKRFEIACYRNKVLDYRAGLEKDLSEVLQTDRIFTNVSKGKFANASDLQGAFGTRDQATIAKIILNNDDHKNSNNTLQVSDLERQQQYQNTLSQIATWVAANCVHPDTQRPYTVSQIKHALGKNYTVHPGKAIKKQYLDCVKFLKEQNVIPIERAKMELTLTFPASVQESNVDPVLQRLSSHVRVVAAAADQMAAVATNHHHHYHHYHHNDHTNNNNNNSTDTTTNTTRSDEMMTICIQVDPSHYRELEELMKSDVVGGRLEIVQQVVAQKEGDVDLELEVLKRINNKLQQQQHQHQQSTDSSNNEPTTVDPTTTQRQQPRGSNGAAAVQVDSDDKEGARLMKKLEQVRLQAAGSGGGGGNRGDDEKVNLDDDDDSDGDRDHLQPMNKKSLRKAQKKNKRAKQKRREHSEEEEQQAERFEEDEEVRIPEDGPANNHSSSSATATTTSKKDAVQQQQQKQQQNQTNNEAAADDANAKSCNTCGGTFANAAQYRAHFRSDWHRFNQKLKLKGIAAVSEQEFMLCDAEEFFGSTN
jgi:ribosome maturation protein SDO1